MIKQCPKCGVLYNPELQRDECPHHYIVSHKKGIKDSQVPFM